MKWLDEVKVINDKYKSEGIKKGDVGTIIMSEIRLGLFEIEFCDKTGKEKAIIGIHVKDLELVRASKVTDQEILEDLPLNDPKWWCKVEDGYIKNLKGEKKNSIPYEYDS